MKKPLSYLLMLTGLTLAAGLLHFWAVPKIIAVPVAIRAAFLPLYLYLYFLHGLAYVLIWRVWKRAFGKTGFVFLGLSLVKLVISVLILYPYLQRYPALAEALVLHFMAPYFVFLLSELLATYRLLSRPPGSAGGK